MWKKNYLAAALSVGTSMIGPIAFAAGDFHCEKKKDGETTDIKDAKNRKDCNTKGGKWVKEHAHGHGAGDEGHKHEDNEKKDDKK